jgi:hypothetical protein
VAGGEGIERLGAGWRRVISIRGRSVLVWSRWSGNWIESRIAASWDFV